MIETYTIYCGDKEEYLRPPIAGGFPLFTISIPEEIFEKRKDSIFILFNLIVEIVDRKIKK
jgi:hypothetical protein